mgnify:CR=1 FL=1
MRWSERLARGPLRRRPLNVVVPIVSLVERRLGGRWWAESLREAPGSVEPQRENASDQQAVDDGVGAPLVRRYEISLEGAKVSPFGVLDKFRNDPNSFAPIEYAAFSKNSLSEGDRTEVRLAGPWNGPVQVVVSDVDRIRLATLDGHMEAGWIDFRVTEEPEALFVIESVARAGDHAFWLLHDRLPIGRWVQADMWARVLESAADYAQLPAGPGRVEVSTIRLDE